MSLPFLPRSSEPPLPDLGGWWYDPARCMFVRGLWPTIENYWSEELVRQVAEEPGPARRKLFARCLLGLIPPGASA